jgi:hypothetical protein
MSSDAPVATTSTQHVYRISKFHALAVSSVALDMVFTARVASAAEPFVLQFRPVVQVCPDEEMPNPAAVLVNVSDPVSVDNWMGVLRFSSPLIGAVHVLRGPDPGPVVQGQIEGARIDLIALVLPAGCVRDGLPAVRPG